MMTQKSLRFVDDAALATPVETEQMLQKRVDALCAELATQVRGEVRFDPQSRALYATDSSNFRIVPLGVVLPRDATDVVHAVACARKYQIPILQRGDGSSLAGQTCNAALIIDNSKYFNQILELDVENRRARVQPGVRCDQLRDRARMHGLTYGVDPSTHAHCTFGGMLGNNSGGVHALRNGITIDQVLELEILTYRGERLRVGPVSPEEYEEIVARGGARAEIYKRLRALHDHYADVIESGLPQIPRRVSGYPLDQLLDRNHFNLARALVGTEGTCVTILEATVTLIDAKPRRTLVALGYPSVGEAGDAVSPLLKRFDPIALEGMDDGLVKDVQHKHFSDALDQLPDGKAFLLLEFGADTQDDADQLATQMIDQLRQDDDAPSIACYRDPELQQRIWEVREAGLGVTAHTPEKGLTWPGFEDSAVDPRDLGDYIRDLQALYAKHNLKGDLYGHFGQGLIHTRINFDLMSAPGVANYRAFLEEAADLLHQYHGSLSGEHGDGQQRAELLGRLYGPRLVHAFNEFKNIWDPDGMMNPGKVVRPNRLDQNLRLGADYTPWEPETHFKYPDDDGKFSNAALRCVGASKCRSKHSGTMCPSYQVTGEEKHSTRGRARLLFEMMNGEETPAKWQNEDVKDALDLCLACKGCKKDCPVSVDMATYKAEFLSHYYEKKPRPRHAYAFGLIDKWAQLAAAAPRLVNLVARTPGLKTMAKKMAGMAPEREIPKFATQTFREWFQARPAGVTDEPASADVKRVILFPDTFNNHFHPEKLIAAVSVLERLGFKPELPAFQLCCGRPLYDYGMLDQAKEYLRRIMATLDDQLSDDLLMVGLEPSCIAVFRDELVNLFPDDLRAQKLNKQTVTLAEFIQKTLPDTALPQLNRRAIVHVHCHHKSIMGDTADRQVLKRLGLDFEVLDSGCCGLAGSFGFEEGHFDISRAIGERVLLPRVEQATADTLIVTDGFSCHTQIEELGHRQSLHLAEVLDLAFRQGGPPTARPS